MKRKETSIKHQYLAKFATKSAEFLINFGEQMINFDEILEFGAASKRANLVSLKKLQHDR